MTSPTPAEIRAARERAGLTQTAAAQLVHSALRTWQQWERGDREMHPGLWELFVGKVAAEPTRWWRVVGPDDEVWCETSSEREARQRMRVGDRLQRLYERTESKWVDET